MADSQRKTANLFDGTLQKGYYEDADGTITGTTSQVYRSFMLSLAAGTYTISFENPINLVRLIKDGTMTVTYDTNITSYTVTSTTDGTIGFSFRLTQSSSTPWDNSNIMLNEGSTALPYEPYGWLHSLRKLTTATEAVENPLYSDGTAITAYTLKGNEEHTGTPSPQNPVMPNGVGERTENLCNGWEYGNIDTSGNEQASNTEMRTGYIPIDYNKIFSISREVTTGYWKVRIYDENKDFLATGSSTSLEMLWEGGGRTPTNPMQSGSIFTKIKPILTGAKYIRFVDNAVNFDENVMMLEGDYTPDTMPTYEPYGYKIPISSGGVTTNIYLGSTQTVRQIKQLVLDGSENWTKTENGDKSFFNWYTGTATIQDIGLCTHFQYGGVTTGSTTIGVLMTSGGSLRVRTPDVENTDLASYKAWLAAQYANGTPVTVWYVLATDTTAAVNEPLMKIGDYADTLSNAVSIPTTEGANSITVDTTVQPSEFTATWTGWHDATVKEWDGSIWG